MHCHAAPPSWLPNTQVGLVQPDEAAAMSAQIQQLLLGLRSTGCVTVAAIRGNCLGGGLELAMNCDVRLVEEGAQRTLGLPEVKLGLLPGATGCSLLPHLVGMSAALRLGMTGESLAPRDALRLRLVDECLPAHALWPQLHQRVRAMARRHTGRGPGSAADASALRAGTSCCNRDSACIGCQGTHRTSALASPRDAWCCSALGWACPRHPTNLLDCTVLGRWLITGLAIMRARSAPGSELYPAPFEIARTMRAASELLPRDPRAAVSLCSGALAVEAAAFGRVSVSAQSKSLCRLFLAGTEAKSAAKAFAAHAAPCTACCILVAPAAVERAGELAEVLALRGMLAVLVPAPACDAAQHEVAQRAAASASALLSHAVRRRRLTDEEATAARARLLSAPSIALAAARVVDALPRTAGAAGGQVSMVWWDTAHGGSMAAAAAHAVAVAGTRPRADATVEPFVVVNGPLPPSRTAGLAMLACRMSAPLHLSPCAEVVVRCPPTLLRGASMTSQQSSAMATLAALDSAEGRALARCSAQVLRVLHATGKTPVLTLTRHSIGVTDTMLAAALLHAAALVSRVGDARAVETSLQKGGFMRGVAAVAADVGSVAVQELCAQLTQRAEEGMASKRTAGVADSGGGSGTGAAVGGMTVVSSKVAACALASKLPPHASASDWLLPALQQLQAASAQSGGQGKRGARRLPAPQWAAQHRAALAAGAAFAVRARRHAAALCSRLTSCGASWWTRTPPRA